jgi:adenosylmethionine-8-amino-7-oxononanoate aminotransferase
MTALNRALVYFNMATPIWATPWQAAAAHAVVTKLTEQGLVARAAEQGHTLANALSARFGQHPHIGDIRGRGLFQGMEFVEDRDSKTPFDPTRKFAARFKANAFENGLICYPMSGTRDGREGDHVLLAPPFIISDDQIGELVDKLEITLNSVIN